MKKHITVLQQESVDALGITKSSTIVDATFGSGGHAREIVSHLGTKGTFVGIDADPEAIARGKETLHGEPTIHLVENNFRNINSVLDSLHIEKADGILADLGWRTEQFSGNGKGFSFLVDEPLIMTFGNEGEYLFTAKDIINDWAEGDIANVLKGYGEERFAKRIAKAIVASREKQAIETTFDLVEIIKGSVPSFYRNGKLHPATRTFQALRIAVNDEFEALESFITQSLEKLASRGRLAIITFHSLEDRIVKHRFRNYTHDHIGVLVTKKPISAGVEELQVNPRARSAKLRVFEKI